MKFKNLILLICISGILILPRTQCKAGEIDAKPPCHTVSLSGSNVSCFGLSDGDATLSISGGSGDFTITWSNGLTGVTELTNLPAGYYDVTVLDNVYGCSAFDIINITEPDLLTTSLTGHDINCYGELTGSVEMSIYGGTTPYDVLWSSSETNSSISGLASGDYSVVVTDINNCQATNSVTLTQPAQALGSNYVAENILCNGDSNGSINISDWGGTPPYFYNWNNNTYNSQDLLMISVGTYNLTLTDSKGCQNTHSIEITGPELLEMTGIDSDNNCYGETTGNILLSVIGGTIPYSFSWANSDFLLSYDSPEISNLPNSSYYVTVTDKNGCSLSSNFEITSPSQMTYTISGENVTALGGTDGQIYFSVNGGVEPYSYDWSNGVSTPNNLNVGSGLYEVTVLDMNNCSLYASIQINEPLEALTFTYISKNTSCHGSVNGEIFSYANGGTPPYQYLWSTGSTLPYLTNLSAGNYILTLTDINSVEFVDTVIITQPEPLMFSHISTTPGCFGFNNGEIDLTLSGGTSPYRYYWYDPSFALAGLTEDLVNISAGQYTVEVIDTMGCRSNYSVEITQPIALSVSVFGSDIQCSGGTTGSITTSVSGGTSPYSYLWSNSLSTPNISSLPAGHYDVTVSDANGCLAYVGASIIEPEPISIELTAYSTSCVDQTDGSITSSVDGGSGGYNYIWSNNETSEDISNLPAGEYSLSITDIFGCEANEIAIVEINNVACLSIPNTFSPNDDGINDTWVIHNINLYPDCFMQIFNQWGTMVFESQSYSQAWDGTYMGNPLPIGTYYYILSFTESLETLKGTITIIK